MDAITVSLLAPRDQPALVSRGERERLLGRYRAVVAGQAELAPREVTAGGRVSALEALATECGLSPLARRLLLLIAAPDLWTEVAREYRQEAADPARPLCDEALLVGRIGAAEAQRVAVELEPDAPLRRYGLIVVEGAGWRAFRPIRANPAVVRALRGLAADIEVDGRVRVVPRSVPWGALAITTGAREAIARAVACPPVGGPGRVVVRGARGSGRRTLLATLADLAGRRLAVIDVDALDALDAVRAFGVLPCVDGLDGAIGGAVRRRLRDYPGPLAIRTPPGAVVDLDDEPVVLDLPPLDEPARLELWRRTLAAREIVGVDVDALAREHVAPPGAIVRAIEQARGAADPIAAIRASLRARALSCTLAPST